MKIRMLGDNHDCWKKGDVFDVHTDEDKTLFIQCHDHNNGGSHHLTDEHDEYVTDISKYADLHEVVEE